MSTVFPRAVVLNPAMAHHVSVVVRHDFGNIQYSCAECEVSHELPIEELPKLRMWLKAQDDVQVLVWIETNG